jgi:hypothetical protein
MKIICPRSFTYTFTPREEEFVYRDPDDGGNMNFELVTTDPKILNKKKRVVVVVVVVVVIVVVVVVVVVVYAE